MKTLMIKTCSLSLLLLSGACGKPATEDEVAPKATEKTVAPLPDSSLSDLKTSINNNDLAELKKVVNNNLIDLSETKIEGETALITAIRSDAGQVRDYLLENGVNVDEASDKGETPLMSAVAANKINSVELLIKKNAKLDKKNHDGDTALHIALKNKYEAIALLLIQHGANIKITDKDNLNSYELATHFKLTKLEDMIRKMLQVDLGTPDLYSFREAIASGDLTTLSLMLKKFPNLGNTYDTINPLVLAMNIKDQDIGQQIAYLLLLNKTDVNGPAKADYSPLNSAIILQKKIFFDLLLNYKANVQLADRQGYSPLIHAIALNNFEMVDKLLNRSAHKKYSFTRHDKKITISACDVVKETAKKLKDPAALKTNKAIEEKLECSFWDWLF